MRRFLEVDMTYVVVTPESAEHGEYAEIGHRTIRQPERFSDVVEHCKGTGIASVEYTYDGLRVQHYPDLDYRTGEETTETTHIYCDSVTAHRLFKFFSR